MKLEIQLRPNAVQAGTVAVVKMKKVKLGMNRRAGELAVCSLNIMCSNQREIKFQKLLKY